MEREISELEGECVWGKGGGKSPLLLRRPSSEGESGLEKDNDVVRAAGRLWVPGAGVGPSPGRRAPARPREPLLCWESRVFCLLFQ